MKSHNVVLCPACAAVFRPQLGEEICAKCEQVEKQRLDELDNEINARAYQDKVQ